MSPEWRQSKWSNSTWWNRSSKWNRFLLTDHMLLCHAWLCPLIRRSTVVFIVHSQMDNLYSPLMLCFVNMLFLVNLQVHWFPCKLIILFSIKCSYLKSIKGSHEIEKNLCITVSLNIELHDLFKLNQVTGNWLFFCFWPWGWCFDCGLGT